MNGNLLHRQKKYEDAIDHYRESISDSIYWLFWDIERLAHCMWRASGDNTSSLRIFQLIYDLIHRLYEDNLYPIPVTQYLLQANIQLAAQNARNSNKEAAYQHLDEIVGILETFKQKYLYWNILLFFIQNSTKGLIKMLTLFSTILESIQYGFFLFYIDLCLATIGLAFFLR